MLVQIVLCLVLLINASSLQYDGDGADLDVLAVPRGPVSTAPVRKTLSRTVDPDDTEVIKGAIQRLLGKDKMDRILQQMPVQPTRSPPPERATPTPTKVSFLSKLTEPYMVPEEPDDRATTTDRPGPAVTAVESGSSEGIQQMDLFDNQNVEYSRIISSQVPSPPISAGAAPDVSVTSPMVTGQVGDETTTWSSDQGSTSSAAEVTNVADAYDTPQPRFRVGDNRTRYSRRTTGSTLNTLCTESADVCRTMCFDREKYRVSCPTTTPRPTTPYLDMTRLLHMLSSLVADYDTNLTDVMNITLHKKGYKQCEPTTTDVTTTTTMPPVTPPMFDYEPSHMTGNVIAKCYVCGMEELGIPRDAHCSDPFAKELLPSAMPDHVALTKKKSYRKYCNYMDMKPWYINGSGIWGKWTGGCAVRWVDLSGVYTQRVCRIRDRPALGNHFVSKRLAKLEFALRKVDDGCMLSPMATLVPFSRGVSLYARIHVCVCSANWCNGAHWPTGSWEIWAAMMLLAAVLS